MKTSHAINGDTVMVTLEIPAADVHVFSWADSAAPASPQVTITMEGTTWHDAAKRVLRQQSIADHEIDPDVIATRALDELRRSVTRGATSFAEPDVQRRRAVSNALLKLSDLVLSGTIQDLSVNWAREIPEIPVCFATGPVGRRRHRNEVLRIEIPTRAGLERTRDLDGRYDLAADERFGEAIGPTTER